MIGAYARRSVDSEPMALGLGRTIVLAEKPSGIVGQVAGSQPQTPVAREQHGAAGLRARWTRPSFMLRHTRAGRRLLGWRVQACPCTARKHGRDDGSAD